jgi:hypothetical protein
MAIFSLKTTSDKNGTKYLSLVPVRRKMSFLRSAHICESPQCPDLWPICEISQETMAVTAFMVKKYFRVCFAVKIFFNKNFFPGIYARIRVDI